MDVVGARFAIAGFRRSETLFLPPTRPEHRSDMVAFFCRIATVWLKCYINDIFRAKTEADQSRFININGRMPDDAWRYFKLFL